MAEIAKHIEVVNKGGDRRLLIDGQEFPWLIGDKTAVSTTVEPGTIPSITVEILAEEVTVRDRPFEEPALCDKIRDFFFGPAEPPLAQQPMWQQ